MPNKFKLEIREIYSDDMDDLSLFTSTRTYCDCLHSHGKFYRVEYKIKLIDKALR